MADTNSGAQPGPETWLAARLAAGRPAETWKPMAKIGRCAFPGYEVTDTGQARSLPRTGRNGRPLQGGPVTGRPHKDGYVLADFRCDNPDCKRAHTFTMQKVVLWTFAGSRPRGKEASHLSGNPQWNWYPEGLAWEDKPTNNRRKPDRPAPPEPTYPCKNAPGCPNLVLNPGRRCLACVAEVGRQAADMLRARRPLPEVAEHFGYTTDRWVYDLAVQHGGYEGTRAEARTQRKPLTGWRAKAARLLGVS